MKKVNAEKKYSEADLKKIRKRAGEIWKRKCQSLNTALDDWLQAERELRTKIGIGHKRPDDYTDDEVRKIKERAQAIRDEKVRSLRTAFNDWIEAEQELKEELNGRINANDLFDLWFSKVSSQVALLLKKDSAASAGTMEDIFGRQYVELMKECMN